jgi:hypothetical protein
LNQFSIQLSSIQKLKKKIGLVVYFGPKPYRTENAQPYNEPITEVIKIECHREEIFDKF